ncbi:MAG: NAD-dependent epimerase/dehydratase family protein [Burkholderiales bacterium]|nr:NAD-dependent epimerase/dehydratase family protein [Burkholderiales bacterium]
MDREASAATGTVIVTGCGGAIGQALCARLREQHRVVGLDVRCPAGDADCIAVDITSPPALEGAIGRVRERHGAKVASVIHLAAYFDMTGEPNPLYRRVNVEGTERLLRALRTLEVEQFVYASTMLVHGGTEPGRPIDEASPLDPAWAYPRSKADAENVVRTRHDTVPIVVLRIAGVYTDQCDSAPLAQQIQRIDSGALTSRLFPGDSRRGQAFVHVDDLVDAIVRAVERRHTLPPDTTLLIGEPGPPPSYAELQHELARLIHGRADWPTHAIPKPVAKAGAWLQDKAEEVTPDAIDQGEEPFIKPFMIDRADDHFELDTARAASLLGWQPRHRLRQALPGMVQALKADRGAWYARHGLVSPEGVTPAQRAALDEGEKKALTHHLAEMTELRKGTLWTHFVAAFLGLWLACSPFALGYAGEPAMRTSDVASGALVVAFAALSMARRFGWAQWANALVGCWLLAAPLVFWTTSPAAYVNDTLVGTLVISLAILVPHMPGMSPVGMAVGPDIPPGWDYSPSDWTQRLPIIVLAFAGFFIARYMAAYQLGHIPSAWDPFFGRGTETIITSEMSRAWPVPDAGLGALGYMLEALSGIMGDRKRWRTMPWMVVLFGVLVVPLGGVSIFFIVIQPIWIGTWCTLCLVAAAAMVIMIPYSLDEIVATVQFLLERRRVGRPLWHVFWHGDTMAGGTKDASFEFDQPPARFVREMLGGGLTAPWTLNACIAIGVALMCTPLLFGTQGAMADSDHFVGSLVIVIAVSAWAEVARRLRLLLVPFGAWLVVAPWLLEGAGSALASAAGVAAGVALIALSLPRGAIRNPYGRWDRFVR